MAWQKGKKDKRDFIFHKELKDLGASLIRVDGDVREIKSKNGPQPVVDIALPDGSLRTYWCENDQCAEFFANCTKGESCSIEAIGSRDDAEINVVDDGDIAPQRTAAPPARPKPSGGTNHPSSGKNEPEGAAVGNAITNACHLEGEEIKKGLVFSLARVTQRTSDILRIAAWHKEGNLMPKAPSVEPSDNDGGAQP